MSDIVKLKREAKPPHVLDPQLVLIREMKDWWMEHGGTADELLARFPECKTRRKTLVADIRKWKRKKEAEQKND